MAIIKHPRILFFTKGPTPTLDDELAAEELAPMRVSFRNAAADKGNLGIETCDGWAGAHTPTRYKRSVPSAEQAREAYVVKREEAIAKARARLGPVATTEPTLPLDPPQAPEPVTPPVPAPDAAAPGWTNNA